MKREDGHSHCTELYWLKSVRACVCVCRGGSSRNDFIERL